METQFTFLNHETLYCLLCRIVRWYLTNRTVCSSLTWSIKMFHCVSSVWSIKPALFKSTELLLSPWGAAVHTDSPAGHKHLNYYETLCSPLRMCGMFSAADRYLAVRPSHTPELSALTPETHWASSRWSVPWTGRSFCFQKFFLLQPLDRRNSLCLCRTDNTVEGGAVNYGCTVYDQRQRMEKINSTWNMDQVLSSVKGGTFGPR